MQFYHPLMHDNFTKADMNAAIRLFKKKNKILTQSKYVKQLKYSVFVNSGSSANLLTMTTLKVLYAKRKREVILPTLTWVSDINSVIQNNLKPVFVDINPRNLCMSEAEIIKKVNKNTLAVFMTHAQGFNGLSQQLIAFLKRKKVLLIEDVSESHGATFNKKKLGTFGIISNFSFYYAHHMSTIEGGMICTNNKKIYETVKILRSHGMVRESNNPVFEKKIIRKYPKLYSKFIFLYPGYNFRNNEVGGVIGLSQLKSLDKNNKKRSENFKFFLELLDSSRYRTDFQFEGSCNYAFPVILKKRNLKSRDLFEKVLIKNKIEFRRGNAGGGNQLRQPYLQKFVKNINLNNFKEVDHIHFFGYYIGNFPSLSKTKIKRMCNILNRIKI